MRSVLCVAGAACAIAGGGCARGTSLSLAEAAPPVAAAPPAPTKPAAGGVTAKLQPSPAALALSDAFADAAAAIRPSVVRLDVETTADASLVNGAGQIEAQRPGLPDYLRRFFGFAPHEAPSRRVPIKGTGSGVIIDGQGDVLTNSHVVSGADRVTIKLPDQRSFSGRVIGTDPLTDVAVVRFEKPPPDLVAARLGDSDRLRTGEWVIAVGSPLAMAQTVTAGIVSGEGATGSGFRFASGERVRKYIQTDAEINPGNSGGPLVDLQGEVLGLNTLINVGPGGGYGFAIPINQAAQVAGILVKEGRVRYPYLGVSVLGLGDLPAALLAQLGQNLPQAGAVVAATAPGGPAEAAGLEPGDVITRIAGRPARTAADVVADISTEAIGSEVSIDYVRGGAMRTARVKVAEYPVEPAGGDGQIGVALETLTPPMAKSLGLDPRTKGAVVTEVVPGSPAEAAGLSVGDVIGAVDRRSVASADDAVAAMRAGKGRRLLRVRTAVGSRVVAVAPR